MVVEISTQDIQTILALLKLAASRGAFQIEEYERIGKIFRQFQDFIAENESTHLDAII